MKRYDAMRQLILILIAVCLSAGCKRPQTAFQNKDLINDTNSFFRGEDIKKVFIKRRQQLLEKTGNGIVLLRSDYGFNGGRHEFRPANNFYYLTGFTLPGSLLVLDKADPFPYTLFIPEKSIEEEIFTGEVPQTNDIMTTTWADTVLPAERSFKIIEKSIIAGKPIYIDRRDPVFRSYILETINKLKGDISLVRDISPITDEMRVFKDSAEIVLIQRAIDITGDGFLNACRTCFEGIYEYEIEAMIEFTYRRNGSAMPAFQSIVGSGPNSVKLHYSENNRRMENGDLLLMDTGSEYGYYCSDITRTIPVSGQFSNAQKRIYELVLKSEKAAIAEMLPGKSIVEGHNKSAKIIARGLYEMGLITDSTSEWQKKFYFLYPAIHYLGLDVHDVGDYGTSFQELMANVARDTIYGRTLKKGMVLTIEPGLYFRSNGLSQLYELYGKEVPGEEIREFIEKVSPVYEIYKNTGVRIEDDVLITENGNIVLSKDIPKEIEAVESIMREGRH